MRPVRGLAIGTVAAAAIAGTSLWAFAWSDDPSPATVARFSSQGVTVSVSVKNLSATHATIVTTFSPDKPGFHLYSADLPADGIQGIGRPIKVEPLGTLHSTGPLAVDAKVLMLTVTGTDISLPAYPDGPVTAVLPVAVDRAGAATLLVSYAACSSATCLPPVTNHPITLQVSASSIT